MSADKHRGIRRERQKRAKDSKKRSQPQAQPAGVQPSAVKASPEQKTA